jgi:hypothetical protein
VESDLHSYISLHGIHKNKFLLYDVLFHDETQEQEGQKEKKKKKEKNARRK